MTNTLKSCSNRLWLLAILVFAAAVRLYLLGAESIWVDEIYTLRVARKEFWDVVTNYDVHPALYYTIMHFWIKVFGETEAGIRLFSVVMGFLTVWMMYLIGKVLFDRRTGLIAAALLAFSSFHLGYSQDARSYALLAFMASASVYFYIQVLKKGELKHWIGHAVCTLIFLYVHNFSTFLVFFQNIHLFTLAIFSKKEEKPPVVKWLVEQGILFLCYLPWILFSLKYGKELSGNFWIEKPGIRSLINTVREYAGGYKLLAVFFAAFLFSLKRLLSDAKSRRWIYFLIAWIAVTMLIPFFISRLWTPIYYPRYTIATSLAFYLIAAFGLASLHPKFLRIAVIVVVIALCLGGLRHYFGHVKKEQWREATAYVDERSKPHDFVLFHLRGTEIFQYYTKKNENYNMDFFPPRRTAGVVPEREKHVTSENIDKLLLEVEGYDRVWFVLSHSRDKDHLIEAKLKEKYHVVDEKEFYQVKVYLFEK